MIPDERLQHPGFTPGARDIPELIARLAGASDAEAKLLERVLLRAAEPAAKAALTAIAAAVRPQRARLVQLLGRLVELLPLQSDKSDIATALRTLARDSDLKSQLNAVTALGRFADAANEDVLLQLWQAAPRPELRRALLRSLGKAGGDAARAVLAQAPVPEDVEERRLLEQASLILARASMRQATDATVRGDAVPAMPLSILLSCRRGLERLLAEEAAQHGLTAERRGDGQLHVLLQKPLATLLQLRLMEWFALPLPVVAAPDDLSRIVATFSSPATQELLTYFSAGTPRYRIDWPAASRAEIWDLAKRLTAVTSGAVNDPRASTWELQVSGSGDSLAIALSPKRLDDPRFAYRQAQVPASSHPTLAAALARLAGVDAQDIVWDPFVGAGTELVERARQGAYLALYGTDLSPDAVAGARANLVAAGVLQAEVEVRDALAMHDLRPTLILTNPPMGRRVARGDLKPLIQAFVQHACQVLAPGGRLVWISPLPETTAAQLQELGMQLRYRQLVDMGGFDAELQIATKAPHPASRQQL